jgi:hypothetical protein
VAAFIVFHCGLAAHGVDVVDPFRMVLAGNGFLEWMNRIFIGFSKALTQSTNSQKGYYGEGVGV